jgi:translocation and assembly module TamA
MTFRRTACRITALLVLSGWMAIAAAQEPAFTWRIELDAPQAVRPLLEKYLDIYRYRDYPEVDAALLDRLVSRTAEEAGKLLATEGYFSPQVDISSTGDQAAGLVRLRVVTGQPAIITTADIKITGAITADAVASPNPAQISARWRLPSGSPFRQAAWDSAKEALLRELLFNGYPAARITTSTAEVDPQSGKVAVAVSIDSGPLFRFGPLEITGLERYPRTTIENLRTFRDGERYIFDALLYYQTRLQASGYFQNVSVTVNPDPANAAAAPVVVRVVEHPTKKIDLGVGYSTDTLFRSEATFTHNNTFQPGWQGLARMRLDTKEQLLESSIALTPEPGGWRNHLGVEAKHSDIENLESRVIGITARRAWRSFEKELDWALKFQVEEQSLEVGPVDHLEALTLNYSWTLRRVDDLLRPKRGYMLNLQLGGASAELLSTRSFSRGYARGLYILPFSATDRMHLRGELGAIWASARDGIPSEFLFRTGGDQSVRGYAYQSLGITQGSATVGGRFLNVATVEYQHDFTPQWGGALFVDAGNAADSFSQLQPVYGYGVGVRWIISAGSINIDVARAQETGDLRLHFTIGARF